MDIGTYSAGWRVLKDGEILLGREDLNRELQVIISTKIIQDEITVGEMGQLPKHEVTFHLSKGYRIEFLSLSSEEEDLVFVFYPEKKVLTLNSSFGWRTGPSNLPWGE